MNDHTRPDPDALLAQIRQDQQRAARGRLRIYFGASAGVGKTCAMLLAARKLVAEGVDVLAGIVDTHGRQHRLDLHGAFDGGLERMYSRATHQPDRAASCLWDREQRCLAVSPWAWGFSP
jgi:K+-sensing histidine kinase KdpD